MPEPGAVSRPRVLFVGRTRYALPLSLSLSRKWDALANVLELRVLARKARGSSGRDSRFELTLPEGGLRFQLALPWRVARELRRFEPKALVVQGPYEALAALGARRLARRRPALIVDVHGDWRTATGLYGSRARALLAWPARLAARFVLRRADAVRTISGYTSGLVRTVGVEPAAVFPAYVDLGLFLAEPQAPLPERPQALFVGVLERYKGIDVLLRAWPEVVRTLPEARLVIVGTGRLQAPVERAQREQSEWIDRLGSVEQSEVARLLDESTLLVLPSRSEGLPRIVMEAFCRGRPVVGTRAGGTPDLVVEGENGLLVESEDAPALAEALVRVLSDRSLAERLAAGAASSAGPWQASAEEFARRTAELVERALRPSDVD
jgi:glycosyltransferase involved in cell wall biosynthesis